ncbi:MAG: hypothetical protein EA350_05365 [Gemmatimonadales bacterium]|nr:MAG: hypothetical protein EA350_05365 [Gemmatimonadales bacterium]
MIKVVDGRRFNTETAERVACASSGGSQGDFRFFSEELFLTPKGTWFIAGEGGAASKYRERAGDMWGWGSKITPLTPDEALDWLEAHDEVDQLEKHFGDQIEDA